jgi:prevent-host-death family protein
MKTVNMLEAKTHLSQLVLEVEAGEEVTIARNGRPVARLVRIEPTAARGFGSMKGRGTVASLSWADVAAGDAAIAEWFFPA